jgi:transposase
MRGFRLHPLVLSRTSPDASWVHARRPFFVRGECRRKAQGKPASVILPLALEAVRASTRYSRSSARSMARLPNGRRAVRQELSAPLIADLEGWLREERRKLSRGNDLARAIDYLLKRWPAFTRFLDDGRICLSNNAAERALRGIALGRNHGRARVRIVADSGRRRSTL